MNTGFPVFSERVKIKRAESRKGTEEEIYALKEGSQMKGLYGFLGWPSEETADGTHKACTEMLMLEYLGHGETYREREKQM